MRWELWWQGGFIEFSGSARYDKERGEKERGEKVKISDLDSRFDLEFGVWNLVFGI